MDTTLELKNGFCEMTQDEMRVIDGGIGFIFWIGVGLIAIGTLLCAYDSCNK